MTTFGLLQPVAVAARISRNRTIAKRAHRDNITLREAAPALGYAAVEEFERWAVPAVMVNDGLWQIEHAREDCKQVCRPIARPGRSSTCMQS
jgi:hypothetical protein